MTSIPNKIFFSNPNDTSVAEDCALWESVKKGNELAFSSLFKKFVNRLFNYGMHFFSDSDLVKDCIQELFSSIWIKRETLSEVVHVKFYLYKSFRNLLLAKISANKTTVLPNFWEEDCGDIDESIETKWIQEEEAVENLKFLQNAVQMLTRRQREAVILRFYNNLGSKEIAEVMGISVESVHNLISKAILLLRVKFNK